MPEPEEILSEEITTNSKDVELKFLEVPKDNEVEVYLQVEVGTKLFSISLDRFSKNNSIPQSYESTITGSCDICEENTTLIPIGGHKYQTHTIDNGISLSSNAITICRNCKDELDSTVAEELESNQHKLFARYI